MNNDAIPQLPNDDEDMTWESISIPDPLGTAIDAVAKAHEEARLPHGSIHVALAMLDVQLAQAFDLRRIAEALERAKW